MDTFVKRYWSELVVVLSLVLVAVSGYQIGRHSAAGRISEPLTVTGEEGTASVPSYAASAPRTEAEAEQEKASAVRGGEVVASKKSKSRLYHFLWCPGAKQIAEANKLVFPDEGAALAAGYTLAKNCKK